MRVSVVTARRSARLAVVSLGAVAMLATPAGANGATVTRGEFQPFAAGAGSSIGGHAQMVRTGDGKTIVSIHVTGLEPGVTYASHVHAASCATGEADGHYMFGHPVGGGKGPAGDEIWPGPVTANPAGIANGRVVVDETPGSTALSVVVHRPGAAPNKIACADLG